ncbi:MAG: CDP-diacylglycerol--serine O-phosphatidyltransferase [Bacteroidales bacterium]|jgi:CDP-diacylglycerol--serine O-phosphatidyltransferase|nr:CDP-diacylglycerol--serine O-phosphatidyltransferase [Bacteroidales bacterium]
MKKHIPNLLTLLNLVCGFAALIYLFKGMPVTASWLIVAGMIFDFSDGFAARLLKAYSDLGRELDSLADLVSFGVVPGMIVYTIASEAGNESMRMVVSALIPVCAAIRLARFNSDPGQKEVFRGMPTPAAAMAIISLLLASQHGSRLATLISESATAVLVYSLVIAMMMILPIRMMSLKFRTLGLRENYDRYLFLLVVVAAIALTGWGGLFLIIPVYVIVSLAGYLSF